MCMEITDDHIRIDKELNKLDRLVLDFTAILTEHTDYVLVAGYVSILFGRSRVSEDIDMLVPRLTDSTFTTVHDALTDTFRCLNSTDRDELYSMLEDGHAIRYARQEEVIPNIEMKFGTTKVDEKALEQRLRVTIDHHTLYVSPIALQIAYKEERLRTPKDQEDALHLREVFKENIDEDDIEQWKEVLDA